jgi:hypothetical protein
VKVRVTLQPELRPIFEAQMFEESIPEDVNVGASVTASSNRSTEFVALPTLLYSIVGIEQQRTLDLFTVKNRNEK